MDATIVNELIQMDWKLIQTDFFIKKIPKD